MVAPTNKANNSENKRQYRIIGVFNMMRAKFPGPALKNTDKVKNMITILSMDDKMVDTFFDSQIKGRYRVAIIAAGAIFTRLPNEPSYSTPSEKLEPASSCSA